MKKRDTKNKDNNFLKRISYERNIRCISYIALDDDIEMIYRDENIEEKAEIKSKKKKGIARGFRYIGRTREKNLRV